MCTPVALCPVAPSAVFCTDTVALPAVVCPVALSAESCPVALSVNSKENFLYSVEVKALIWQLAPLLYLQEREEGKRER